MDKKCCVTCGKSKPVIEFTERPKGSNKYRGQCKICRKAQNADRYHENKADRQAKSREYYQAHKAECQARIKAYDFAHHEERLPYFAEYRAKRRDDLLLYFRDYYQLHRSEKLRYRKENQNRFRDRIRANNTKRYVRQRHALVSMFTGKQWTNMKESFGYRCAYCGKKPKRLTMDHVIPLSKGGIHAAENIVPACMACNNHKKANPPLPFHPDFSGLTKHLQQSPSEL